jgi:isoleucyl-tRNA synthetase
MMPFARALPEWRYDALAVKWDKIRDVRSVVTGALEIQRANKTIGSSLEAAPQVYINLPPAEIAAVRSSDFAEVCITSAIDIVDGAAPAGAFTVDGVKGVGVVFQKAEGAKCARSWKISKDIGTDKDFPDITPRDAEAVREWQKRFKRTV